MKHLNRRRPERLLPVYGWIATVSLVAMTVACGETTGPTTTSEPVTTTAPTTSTEPPDQLPAEPPDDPAPTTTPSIPDEVAFWGLDGSSTGSDFAALLTSEEATCLENRLQADYGRFLDAPLAGEAGDMLEGEGSGPSPSAECLAVERLATARISMFQVLAGGLSLPTRACITDLAESADVIEELGHPDGPTGTAAMHILACLTPEEAARLTPPDEGPPPDTAGIACLMDELMEQPSGEHIISVLSGQDTSGEGLTMAESEALGKAVEACGIETDFGFPDSGETAPSP